MTSELLQINFNRRSAELQPIGFKSTAATGSISRPVGRNGHPDCLWGSIKEWGPGCWCSTSGDQRDHGLGTWELGSWGDGELGTLNPVCLDTSYLLVVRDTRLLMHVTAINCM